MHKLLKTTAALSVLALTSCARAQNAPTPNVAAPSAVTATPTMKLNTFTRGVYWPFERTAWLAKNAGMDIWPFSDKVMGDLKNRYHVDVIWVVNIGYENSVKLADIGAKYGIGVLPATNAVYDLRGVRTQEAADKMAQITVEKLGGAPNIAAYVLLDEPKRGEVEQLEATRAAIAELDPNRPSLVVSTVGKTEAVARRTKSPFLVSDPYGFFGPNSPNGPNTPADSRQYYLDATRQTVSLAHETNKTPWIMPQIYSEIWGDWHYDQKMNVVAEPGAYYHWRMPTTGETRWQVWQAVGEGAKGVIFFVLFPNVNPRTSAQDAKDMKYYRVFKPKPDWPLLTTETSLNAGTAILRNDGSSTPQGEAMGETFAVLEPQRALLGRMESAPPVAFADAPLRATTFRDPANGKTIVVVVNDNTDEAVTGKVRLLPTVKSARDLINGSDVAAQTDAATKLSELPLKIAAGGGALLELDGEATAMQTYVEDFGIQSSAGKLQGVQKVLWPEAWGMGYRVAVKTEVPKAGDAGQLQYDLSQVAGDWKRMKGRLYLVYKGSKRGPKEGIEVAVSSDGKAFRRISADEFDQPIAIPEGSTQLRFSLLNPDAMLDGWQMISVL